MSPASIPRGMPQRGRCVGRHSGVTLVEVLVALVVLSIGLLGIAALYVETLRANRTALSRTQAVNLVNDMADRIRANSRAGAAYATATYAGAADVLDCVVTANCSAPELAEDDLARWMDTVEETLPEASATVQHVTVAGEPDRYSISVQWQEANETLTYQTNFQVIPVPP